MKVRMETTEIDALRGEIIGETKGSTVTVSMSREAFKTLKENNGLLIRLEVFEVQHGT